MNYVILLCDDLKRMTQFYSDVLGFAIDESEQTSDWVPFRVGASLLCLRPRGRWYDGSHEGGGASIQLSFRVAPSAVDVAHDRLQNASVEVLSPPTDEDFGHRTLYLRDPESNILEIYAEI